MKTTTSFRRLSFLLAALAATMTLPAATNCVPPPSDMIAWWAGDGDARDFVSTNHGVLRNGATFTNGLVGEAFLLDGIDDYVEVPDSPNFTLTTAFTVEGWVMASRLQDATIASQYDTHQRQASWGFRGLGNDGRLRFGVYSGGHNDPGRVADTLSPVLVVNSFVHIAGTVDLTTQTLKIYANGSEVPFRLVESDAVPTFFSSSTPVRIGAFVDNGGSIVAYFAGVIDELSLYNRVLSSHEIAAIYDAGSAGKCRRPPAVELLSFAPEVTNTTCIPLSFGLTAQAVTGSYLIRRVEYYDGATLVGQSTNWARRWRTASAALPHGLHSITAQAEDTYGLRATSQVATVILKWPELHVMHGNLTTNNEVVCCMGTTPGSNYVIEATTSMGPTWSPYLTNRPAGDLLIFTNRQPLLPQLYFRGRQAP